MDFDQKRNLRMKKLFLVHNILHNCISNISDKRFSIQIWSVLTVTSLVLIITNDLIFISFYHDFKSSLIFFNSICGASFTILFVLVYMKNSKNILQVLDKIEKSGEYLYSTMLSEYLEETHLKHLDIMKMIREAVALEYFMWIIYFFFQIIRGDKLVFESVESYVQPFPAFKSVKSMSAYVIVNIFYMILTIPMFFYVTVGFCFVTGLTSEIFNQFKILAKLIDVYSHQMILKLKNIEQLEQNLEKIKSRKRYIVEKRIILKKKEDCFNEFSINFTICIKRHQKLILILKCLKPFLNKYFSITLFGGGLIWIILGFFAGKVSWPFKAFDFFMLGTAMGQFVFMFYQCYIGQTFIEMNKMIHYAVYNTPWYRLPPKYRKNVHIFLCQTQNPMIFEAMKTIYVSLSYYPKLINFVYANMCRLETLQYGAINER